MQLPTCAAGLRLRFITIGMLLPTIASAHVKWFSSYDVMKAPKALPNVVSSGFFIAFSAFVTLLFAVFVLDGWVAKRWPGFESLGATLTGAPEKLVRLGTGAFFLCTWTVGLNILTPELHTQAGWIFGIQFIVAICTAWRRTCILSALGIALCTSTV